MTMNIFTLFLLVTAMVAANADDGRCPKELLHPTAAYCGRGGQPCPEGYFCNISPVDAFAECCRGCKYNGQIYSAGQSFPSVDGCNTCFCSDGGIVGCTRKFCEGCVHNKMTYAFGTVFDGGLDGKCVCLPGGCVECTGGNGFCEYNGLLFSNGRFYDKCNRCTCSRGNVDCSKRKCDGRCENGLQPVSNEICGGIAGLTCTEGVCDLSNVPANVTDGAGICCQEFKCKDGSFPLGNPRCDSNRRCPFGYECEMVAYQKYGVCCQAKGCCQGGVTYAVGDEVETNDPCTFCTCALTNGKYEIICAVLGCARPNCENPVRKPGKCCPVCEDDGRCPKELLHPTADYCGRGGQPCPEGYFCNISPVDAFAECCRGCKYNGQIYSAGQSFPSVDGCNTCFCSDGGIVGCTRKFCEGCVHNKMTYAFGTVFDGGLDGKCVCLPGGCVECTGGNGFCEYNGLLFSNGRFYDKCNRCTCSRGNVDCSKRKCDGRCENGLQPVSNEICGGIAGLTCTEGVCDLSNVPPNVTDGAGICCEEFKCKDGSFPLGNPRCDSNRRCPFGFKCEMVAYQKYGVCCQAKGCCQGGVTYAVGDEVETNDPCTFCTCALTNGKYEIICAVLDCARPNCENPVRKPGKCCPVCEDDGRCPKELLHPTAAYCGRGGQPCPEGYFCNISPVDAFAECCRGCKYNGQIYPVDQSFPSVDGCNTCLCKYGGIVGCTRKFCPGACPKMPEGQVGICIESCSENPGCMDSGNCCTSPEQCCSNGCGHQCMPPTSGDCSAVSCLAVECPDGYERTNVPGICCQLCIKSNS